MRAEQGFLCGLAKTESMGKDWTSEIYLRMIATY